MTPATNDASGQYADAHATHYTAKDLRKALHAYNAIIVAHPDSAEAGYSRTQILNIASSVIAKDVLLQTQMELVLAELGDVRDDNIADSAPGEEVS